MQQMLKQPLLEAFLRHLAQERRYSPATIAAYRQDLENFIAFMETHQQEAFNEDLCARLTPENLHSWLAALARSEQAASTRQRRLAAVRAFFGWLATTRGVTNARLNAVRGPKTPPSSPRALSIGQTGQLLAALPAKTATQKRDRALMLLLYGTGLRISEALALDWEEGRAEALTIAGKGNKQRRVPLPTEVRSALATLPGAPETPLFQNRSGQRLSPRMAQKIVAAARKVAGLPDHLTPHALRHGYGSHLLEEGADIRTVQELLGHESLGTTQRYLTADTRRMVAAHSTAHPLGGLSNGSDTEKKKD